MLGELQNVIVLAAPFFLCVRRCVGMCTRNFEAVVNRNFTELPYDKQLFLYMKYLVFCCELLSNLYHCPMTNIKSGNHFHLHGTTHRHHRNSHKIYPIQLQLLP